MEDKEYNKRVKVLMIIVIIAWYIVIAVVAGVVISYCHNTKHIEIHQPFPETQAIITKDTV